MQKLIKRFILFLAKQFDIMFSSKELRITWSQALADQVVRSSQARLSYLPETEPEANETCSYTLIVSPSSVALGKAQIIKVHNVHALSDTQIQTAIFDAFLTASKAEAYESM